MQPKKQKEASEKLLSYLQHLGIPVYTRKCRLWLISDDTTVAWMHLPANSRLAPCARARARARSLNRGSVLHLPCDASRFGRGNNCFHEGKLMVMPGSVMEFKLKGL